MRKRLRRSVHGRRVHRWPLGSTAGTAPLHEPGVSTWAGPDDCLPLPFPGCPAELSRSDAPDDARGLTHLRLVSAAPAPRPSARLETDKVYPESDNRCADAEAALGLLLVVLIFLGIAQADNLRGLTGRAVVAIERHITALEEVRIGLRTAYAELRWRAGGLP